MTDDRQADDRSTGGRASREALMPGSCITAYIEAAKSVDLDPYHLLRRMRLPTFDPGSDALSVPQRRFVELLEVTSRLALRPDFPLSVAARLGLASFGPVGLLVSAQPTLREALDAICAYTQHAPLKTRARLEIGEATSSLRFTPKGDLLGANSSDLVLGVAVGLVRELIGEAWRPSSVMFAAPAPSDLAPYRSFFGEVLFDQPFDELRFPTNDLARPIPTANPGLARLVSRYLRQPSPPAGPAFADEVRELVSALLPRGSCSIAHVAERLGVDRRTVHRRLAERGLSFSELVQSARRDIVQATLKAGAEPMTSLSQALGFSCVSAFSRWFRHTYGVSATQFRRAA